MPKFVISFGVGDNQDIMFIETNNKETAYLIAELKARQIAAGEMYWEAETPEEYVEARDWYSLEDILEEFENG